MTIIEIFIPDESHSAEKDKCPTIKPSESIICQ